jgi:hypothetical protein
MSFWVAQLEAAATPAGELLFQMIGALARRLTSVQL